MYLIVCVHDCRTTRKSFDILINVHYAISLKSCGQDRLIATGRETRVLVDESAETKRRRRLKPRVLAATIDRRVRK